MSRLLYKDGFGRIRPFDVSDVEPHENPAADLARYVDFVKTSGIDDGKSTPTLEYERSELWRKLSPSEQRDAVNQLQRWARSSGRQTTLVERGRGRARVGLVRNGDAVDAGDAEDAIEMYKRFQRLEPTDIGDFDPKMKFPAKVRKLGKALWVTYRSKKVDPETLKKPKGALDYIHEHEAGVETYDLQGDADCDVPGFIRNTTALCLLGELLGFAWKEKGDDADHEAKSSSPRPELYTIPSGKALVVVQDKREILALMWGGGLGVEGRGIVG